MISNHIIIWSLGIIIRDINWCEVKSYLNLVSFIRRTSFDTCIRVPMSTDFIWIQLTETSNIFRIFLLLMISASRYRLMWRDMSRKSLRSIKTEILRYLFCRGISRFQFHWFFFRWVSLGIAEMISVNVKRYPITIIRFLIRILEIPFI